ncbi:MAG: type II toxin-antitoxin system HicA family toxin [Methanosarcinaceae archaeon]|nr:type II toxin-antitoxin system HicA family toxin [Methanosarcinaceae archaeon]
MKALNSIGFQIVSQKGSHIKMKGQISHETFIVIIPNYKEIPIGTLKSIIRQSGLSPDEFIKLL